MNKTGVFGSAFNPPTRGHLDVLVQAAPHFDRILLLPSMAHAFNKNSLPIAQRIALLEAFCTDIDDLPCTLEVSLIEQDILDQAPDLPVYTWTVLDALSRQSPTTSFSFIRGPDNADPAIWQKFYRYRDIEQRWPIFTAKEQTDTRSTKVRTALAALHSGSLADRNQLQNWLTPSVIDLIVTQRLYHAHD